MNFDGWCHRDALQLSAKFLERRLLCGISDLFVGNLVGQSVVESAGDAVIDRQCPRTKG